MTRDELIAASDVLTEIAEDVEDESIRERLTNQAEQLVRLAEQDRGPDHGRLARHQQTLRELKAAVDADTAARIDTVNEHIVAYRETVEGV